MRILYTNAAGASSLRDKKYMKSLITLIFWRDQFIRIVTIFSAIILAMLWVLTAVKIVPLSAQNEYLPLHYNIYFGVDLIGAWYKIFAIPGAGTVFFIVNCALAVVFYKKEKILSYFVAAANFILSIGLAVALVLIILLNI